MPTKLKRGDRPVFRLIAHLALYKQEGTRHSCEVLVPKGFLTDYVSAPAWARKYMPLKAMQRASVVHDYLFNMSTMKRSEANRIFLRAMKADGVSFFWRWAAYLYVSRPFAPRVTWLQPYIGVATPA
jgi:hypothetical protein